MGAYGVNMAYLIQDLSKNMLCQWLNMLLPYVKDKDISFGMPV